MTESPDWEVVRHGYQDLFAELALQSADEIMGSDQKEWADRLESERDNLRAALQRLADEGATERALDMGAALWRFWQLRGNLTEGRATLEELLARPDAGVPTLGRARALSALGGLAYWQSDMPAAERAYVEGLAIERSQDDPVGLAEALYNLGFVRAISGKHAEARALYEEALEIASRIGDQPSILRYQEALAFLMFHMGEFAAARQLQEQNVAAFKAAQQSFRAAVGSGFLSYLEAKDGRYEIARAMQREAFGVFREAEDRHWMVRELMVAAASAASVGDLTLAAQLSGAYDVLREPLGEMATPIKTLNLPDPMAQAREGLGEEAFANAYAGGRAMTLDEVASLLG